MRMRIPVKGDDGPTRAIPLVRVLLRRLQRSDLNLRAAYRRIPILATAQSSVRYTRALTRSVARKSIEEIANLLAIREGPAVAADRARLATLDWHAERHLALVQDHYANIRANIVYESLDRRGRGRVQMAAELPLLYPASRRSNPPLVRFPEPELESTPRMPRRHRTLYLEPEPFLTTLRSAPVPHPMTPHPDQGPCDSPDSLTHAIAPPRRSPMTGRCLELPSLTNPPGEFRPVDWRGSGLGETRGGAPSCTRQCQSADRRRAGTRHPPELSAQRGKDGR